MGEVWKASLRFAIVASVLVTAACDQAQLLAPTSSTITVSAPSRVLPLGGSTEVSAFVIEQGGTPVQNGTTVRFTATLGSVNPVEAQTVNGLAMTTFLAGSTSGVAEVRAISGGATGTTTTGTGTTATSTTTNVVQIMIGAAAVTTVTVRANPGSVGPGGGAVELIATVVAENGRGLEGIPVVFSTDQGTLTSATATTNSSGEARTTLVTSQQSIVIATAGTKPSEKLTIAVRSGPSITITCTPALGTATNCAAVQTSSTSGTATVLFKIDRPTTSSTLRSATIDFGDGTSQSLGNLQGGTATITHTYTGPTGDSPRTYTATVVATDVNSEVAAASVTVILTPKAAVTPINVTITATPDTATAAGHRWTFTANVTGGGEGTATAPIESYFWNFDAEEDDTDDTGETATTSGNVTAHIYNTSATGERYTVTVRVRTVDGRTATGRTEIVAGKFPL